MFQITPVLNANSVTATNHLQNFVGEGLPSPPLGESLTQSFHTSDKSAKWTVKSASMESTDIVSLKVNVRGNI